MKFKTTETAATLGHRKQSKNIGEQYNGGETDSQSLEVHLADRQKVKLRKGQEREEANRQRNESKLTMWFAAIRKFLNTRHLNYDQFPWCFRWQMPVHAATVYNN